MLHKFVETLCSELELSPVPKQNEKKIYPFRLNGDVEIALCDLEPGVSLQSKIGICPEKRREEIFIFLMRANLLGQGTGGARIGLDEDEKTLTLSLGLPYEMNYKAFREHFEDFVNYLVYWKDEIRTLEHER